MLSISALAIFPPYPKRYLPFWLLRKSRVALHRQLSFTAEFTGFLMMGGTELESVTSTMSTWRSNQLS